MANSVDELKSLISKQRGLARSNLFQVQLPGFKVFGEPREFNVLCKSTELPGRQILSIDRAVGMQVAKVAYGYGVSDVNLTFRVTNNYNIKKYFDYWQQLAINRNSYEAGYFKDYVQDVKIYQLRKDRTFNFFNRTFNQDGIAGTISRIGGGIFGDINIDLGPVTIGTEGIQVGLTTERDKVYGVTLQDAYPTSVTAIPLSDDNSNGLVEVNVQLSYVDWKIIPIDPEDGAFDEGITGVILGVLDSIFN